MTRVNPLLLIGLAVAISVIPTWILAVISGLIILVAGYGLVGPFLDFKGIANAAVGGVEEHKAEISAYRKSYYHEVQSTDKDAINKKQRENYAKRQEKKSEQ
jgi:hypothetical protein